MLHVVNGDATLPSLEAAGVVPAEGVLVWRDMLSEGPVPHALASLQAEVQRAHGLALSFRVPAATYLADAQRAQALVAGAKDGAVAWFDEDLFCQANLARVLTLLPADAPAWVVPPRHGSADPVELEAALAARTPLAQDARDYARRAWAAFGAADPRALELLVAEPDAQPLPRMAEAFAFHLTRFPSVADGLGSDERALLDALARGPANVQTLLAEVNAHAPFARHRLTNVTVLALLCSLARGEEALVEMRDDPVAGVHAALAPAGRRVLAGEADRVELVGIDRWLGGVHVRSPAAALWRWDAARQALVAPD